MLATKLDRLFLRYRDADDGRALARVFDLVATDLYRFALHLARDAETAEDLVQCSFLAAIERRDSYEARGRFFSWIAGILANEWRRQRRRAGRDLGSLATPKPREDEVVDQVADREFRTHLGEALAGIPEPYRGVLDLKLSEDLESAAIAGRLGRPEGTVRSQLHRGLDLLRKILPAGLGSLVVTAMPRQALARARDATLGSAGFSPATGTIGLAALETSAGFGLVGAAVVAVVLGTRGGHEDSSLAEPATEAAFEGRPRYSGSRPASRSEPVVSIRSEVPPTPPEFQEEVPGGWHTILDRVEVRLPDGSILRTGEARMAPTRGQNIPKLNSRGKNPAVLPSTLLKQLSFDDFRSLPSTGLILTEEDHRDLVAQIFMDGLDYGFLLALRHERRDRPQRASPQRLTMASRVLLHPKSESVAEERVTAILQTREGIKRLPFVREGKRWELTELVPLPLEVEISGGHRPPIRMLVWKTKVKLPDLASKRDERLPLLRISDGLSGQHLSGLEPRLRFGTDPSLSVALNEVGAGLYRLPDVSLSSVRKSRLEIGGAGCLTPFISLRKFRPRGGDEPFEVVVLPTFASAGRLLESDGRPASGARIRVHQVAQRLLFEAISDEAGAFRLTATEEGLGSMKPADLDANLTVTVQTFDGRHARFDDLTLRDLAAGPRLSLKPGPSFLDVVLIDAKGEPVPRAQLSLSVPDPEGKDAWPIGSDQRFTDEAGRCRFHGFCGGRVQIEARVPGRLREIRIFDVDGETNLEYRLLPAAPIDFEFLMPAGVTVNLDRQTLIFVQEEGPTSPSEHQGQVRIDAEGKGSILAPLGKTYSAKINLHYGRRRDELSLRLLQDELGGLIPGSHQLLRVLVGKQRKLVLVSPSGESPRSALIFLPDDPIEATEPWAQRNRGFGGSWSPGYSVSLPLGSVATVVVAAGFRPARVTIHSLPESNESVELKLRPGIVLTGRIRDWPAGRRSAIALRLLEIPGVDLPSSWLESYERSTRASCLIEADGSFRSPALVPGRYRLSWLGRELGEFDLLDDVEDLELDLE